MTAEILPGGDKREVWMILSKTKGTFQVRAWMKTFGIFESAESALAAVSRRHKTDPGFRRRSRGQQFFPARIDWFVESGDIALLTRYRNEVIA